MGLKSVIAVWLALGMAATFGAPGRLLAQYTAFGKNKVQYSDLEWRVLESPHFELYYYDGEEELAAQALDLAEEAYGRLRERFAMDVARPIPLIIYSSHQDFEQTNVTPYFLPEGVAGLTEFARGRVLVPFDGSLHAFRTTIQHELVHVYQLAVLDRIYREHYRSSPLSPPLWVTEGLAVHWSESRDTEADMVLRGMVLSGNLPPISEFWRYEGSYVLYKLGQSVMDFIGEEWGEDRVRELYERIWAWDRFEDVISDVLGIKEEELSRRWMHEVKRRYFPQITSGEPAALQAPALTRRGGSDFKPIPLPSSIPDLPHHFAFVSPRNGYTNIYTASHQGKEEKDVHTLVEGERRGEFESLHAFRSRMDVNDAGELLFVSKHEGRDEIVRYSLAQKRVLDRFAFDELAGIASPGWAPAPVSPARAAGVAEPAGEGTPTRGGKRFVFSGLTRDGYSDLFVYDMVRGHLRRLTHDRYQDLDPSWCPWADAVVWSSDRCAGGDGGAMNLFWMDLSTEEVRPLTRGLWKDQAPVCDAERSRILFTSDRDGFFQTYLIDDQGNGRRITSTLDAVMDPRPIPRQKRFLATVFSHEGFQVRRFDIPDSSAPAISLAPEGELASWDWRRLAPPVAAREAAYRSKFSLDVAQAGVLFDPGLRTGEGLQAAFSDMMGNHLIFVGVGHTNFSTSEFLRNFSAAATYVNLGQRLNYGVTAFHYAGDFYDELEYPFYEKRIGGGLLLRYPTSKYERIEGSLTLGHNETDRPTTAFRRKAWVGNYSLSLIRDTSLWLLTGPIDGQRMNLTIGQTVNLEGGKLENTQVLGDLRKYFRLGLRSSYAVRMQGWWSRGDNPEFFLLGGSHSLRVWPRRAFNGTRALLLNQEARFPLIRMFVLGLPIGNLELPEVQGALFVDAGSAWDEGWPPPWRGAFGAGLRMGFGGYMVFRLDVGRRTDWRTIEPVTRTQFHVGWNY